MSIKVYRSSMVVRVAALLVMFGVLTAVTNPFVGTLSTVAVYLVSKMNKQERVTILCSAFVFSALFVIPAYADDAVTDILNQPRFAGAVGFVNSIGRYVDNIFMAVISFVSFFIISAACLRNVLAGAYCVFPKFWEKVHQAHETMKWEDRSLGDLGQLKNVTSVKMGSIQTFLLSMVWDIKVLTDFDGANPEDVDYKRYFMKAIPQCVCAVFVGVFIYNGTYRDVMAVTSRFGMAVANNALTSIKPEQVLETFTNIRVNINYGVKDAPDGTRYIANEIHKKLVGIPVSHYTDQNLANNKELLYQNLSNYLETYCAQNYAAYNNTKEWAVDVRAFPLTQNPTHRDDYVSEDGLTHTKFITIPVNDGSGVQLNTSFTDVWYLEATVVFTNKGAQDNGAASVAVSHTVLTVGVGDGSGGNTVAKTIKFTGGSYGQISSGTGSHDWGGTKFTLSQSQLSATSGTSQEVTITFDGNVTTNQALTNQSGNGLRYNAVGYGELNITEIIFSTKDTGTSVSVYNANGDMMASVKFGEDLNAALSDYMKNQKRSSMSTGGNGGGSNEEESLEDAE